MPAIIQQVKLYSPAPHHACQASSRSPSTFAARRHQVTDARSQRIGFPTTAAVTPAGRGGGKEGFSPGNPSVARRQDGAQEYSKEALGSWDGAGWPPSLRCSRKAGRQPRSQPRRVPDAAAGGDGTSCGANDDGAAAAAAAVRVRRGDAGSGSRDKDGDGVCGHTLRHAGRGLVRYVRGWADAREVLELAGGPEDAPSPGQQLSLLSQLKFFGEAVGEADSGGWPDGAGRGGATRGGGAEGAAYPAGLRIGQAAPRGVRPWPPVSGRVGGGNGSNRRTLGSGDGAADPLARAAPPSMPTPGRLGPTAEGLDSRTTEHSHRHSVNGALSRHGAAAKAGSRARAAAEEACWAAEWELEWDEWERHHMSDGDGYSGAASLPLAVLLPGHAAAAEATAAAPPLPPAAGLRFIPIAPPPRVRPPPQQRFGDLHVTADAGAPRQHGMPDQRALRQPHIINSQSDRVAARQPAAGAGADSAAHPAAPSPAASRVAAAAAPTAAAPAAQRGGDGLRPAGAAAVRVESEAALATEVLARVVHDAAVARPDVWSDSQVAALLRSAAKLAYRYPGLLSERDPARPLASPWASPQRPLQPPPEQPAMAAGATAGVGAPGSYASSHIGGGGGGGGGGMAEYGDGTGGGAAAGGSSTAVQLRVGLQQLLLRLDGMLGDSPRRHMQGASPGPAVRAARNSGGAPTATTLASGGDAGGSRRAARTRVAERGTGPGAGAEQSTRRADSATERARRPFPGTTAAGELSPADAAVALWAAAALQLRLSPSGSVRRRLMAAFRPRRLRGRGVDRSALPRRVRFGARRSAGPPAIRPYVLAEALWGMGKLGMQVPMPWLDAALRSLSGWRPTARLAARLRRRAGGVGGRSTPGSDTAAFSNDDSGGAAGAAAIAAVGLASLNAVQLCNVAWAVVELTSAAGREEVTRVWAAPLFAASQGRLSELSPSQLVDLLWSIARGRRTPTGPWRVAAAAALAAAAPRLAPWQLARVMAALAKLRLPSPFRLVAVLLAALRNCLTAATPADVAAVVWALRFVTPPYTQTFVRMYRRDLLDLAAATLPCLPSLAPAQLVQLADGFAHLGLLPGVEWMRAHREACIRLRNHFTEANRRKVRQAYALMMNIM